YQMKQEDRPLDAPRPPIAGAGEPHPDRRYLLERIDEAAVVQLYADGFEALTAPERVLVWHLAQAAIAGRDIYYDQRHACNLEARDVLEAILTHADGIEPAVLAAIT